MTSRGKEVGNRVGALQRGDDAGVDGEQRDQNDTAGMLWWKHATWIVMIEREVTFCPINRLRDVTYVTVNIDI